MNFKNSLIEKLYIQNGVVVASAMFIKCEKNAG